jgi:hypothetical protein
MYFQLEPDNNGLQYQANEVDLLKEKPQEKLNSSKTMGSNPTSTHNHYSALLEDESEDQQQITDLGNTPKLPPIYVSDVTTRPLFIQLLRADSKTAI